MSPDGLVPMGAKTSEGTLMIKFRSQVDKDWYLSDYTSIFIDIIYIKSPDIS